ncbi:phospholipase effector Tle1 domain-containing protein, partial [Mycobacteroides abscessus]
MAKNIVICFDGTGNQIRASGNTNVVRGYDMMVHDLTDRQISYYDPGVGTDPVVGTYTPGGQFIARLLGVTFGIGLRAKLAQAYTYLIERWEPGDRIFIFGFSRGAFCARGLAGLLNSVGMLRAGSQNLVPYAVSLYAQSCT